VRRALVRGRYGPPKSKHSRRDVPLSAKLVSDLRRRRKGSEWGRDDDFVFPSLEGTPLQHSNLMRRVLRPVAEEVGAP
jgi:integrase